MAKIRLVEPQFKYLLCGLRLLNALCDIASHHSILEQVLFVDVNVTEQMLDLMFFMTILLARYKEQVHASRHPVLLHSSLLASSFYFLKQCVCSEWLELSDVLDVLPKVDEFSSAAFVAVDVVVNFLEAKLSVQHTDIHVMSNVAQVYRLSNHCEASVQFLQSLCQQKLFRERLVKNKELCEEGYVLRLVQDIMKLPLCEDSGLKAVVCRLKSKALHIILHLCEGESISFLNLASSTNGGLDLAKSTVFEVLQVLRIMFCRDLNAYHPRGILELNAMRLTEILSADSNFRSYITLNLTEVLTKVSLLPQGEFMTKWCSSDPEPAEADVTLNYDSFLEAGHVLGVESTSQISQSRFSTSHAPAIPYAHQKTSLLVKIIVNLTSKEGLFLHMFLQRFQNLADAGAEKATAATRNLDSFLRHSESMIPQYLNEQDVAFLSLLVRQLEQLVATQQRQEAQLQQHTMLIEGGKETMIMAKQLRAHATSSKELRKKRKRNIMNTTQVGVIETALGEDPDLHRNASSLQIWADKLSLQGSKVTSSQLKNWLNNRKAKLARVAAKDVGAPYGINTVPDSPERLIGEFVNQPPPSPPHETRNERSRTNVINTIKRVRGQQVVVTNDEGEEIGMGNIHLAKGTWFGSNLEERGLCVVDVYDLKWSSNLPLPHPCDATGTTFAQAEQILGRKRVLWDSDKLLVIQRAA